MQVQVEEVAESDATPEDGARKVRTNSGVKWVRASDALQERGRVPAAHSSPARPAEESDTPFDPNTPHESLESPPAAADSQPYFQQKLSGLESGTWYEVCVIAINQRGSSGCGSDKELSSEDALNDKSFSHTFLVHTLSTGMIGYCVVF